ncbi:MAG TPA: glycosyltransferase [Acidimicrobiales bacterium]|nr:glycosyltransferase [Acidimicrobiales bacterium]
MSVSQHEPRQVLAALEQAVDSVYFLLSRSLHDELESNRWHYARRWARHFPVTLLEPSQVFRFTDAKPVPAIPNCEVLSIVRPLESADPLTGLIQAGQVLQHMRQRGHAKPLLWSYNPRLAGLYASVPAAGRVYHATENHFEFERLSDSFYREVEASVLLSDLVIAVSSGVADGIRSRIPGASIATITNGCDTGHYQPAGAESARIVAERSRFARVASFAGTINERLDFDLIERAAAANSRTLLVFVGPVSPLTERDEEAWRRIVGLDNVLHLERMDAAEMAALYRSSDLGFIPYRHERFLVQSGFPLKTLEMAATGLPVVSSHMKPIAGLASAIAVAADAGQFLDSFASVSRSTLADEERLELVEVAAANDYDRKFEEVVATAAGLLPPERGVQTRLDDLLLEVGYESWSSGCVRIFNRFAAPPVVAFVNLYDRLAAALPKSSGRLVPTWFKDYVRSLRAE